VKYFIYLQAYSVYIEISCPNIPLLDDLRVQIPELEAFNFYQFDLKETVEIVSHTNIVVYLYKYNSDNFITYI